MIYKIPLIKKIFYNEKKVKKEMVKFIKKNNKFTMGDKVKEFEAKFSEWQGCKYSVMVNSGASANIVLLQALLNLGLLNVNSRVGISSLTWATNIMPAIQLGLYPVIFDIDDTLNINYDKFAEYCAKHPIKCLFLTNALSSLADIEKIKQYCEENNIILLEDNCESLGTTGIYNTKSGNYGLASTFSFYAGHHLSTIEGGMICTNNFDLYEALKIARSNGWLRDTADITKDIYRSENNISKFNFNYSFASVGMNVRPTEIQAIIGLKQLEDIEKILEKREDNFNIFKKIIDYYGYITTVNNSNCLDFPAFCLPIICKNIDTFNILLKNFEKYGIETRPLISGDIQDHVFYKKLKLKQYKTPVCKDISSRSFYIANNPHLTDADFALISKALQL